MLPFWVGSVTLPAVMGLLGCEKPSWSSWSGEQAVLEGWLMLFCRTRACVKGLSLQTSGIMGNAEIGFCFAMVLCKPSCLSCSEASSHCFFGKVFASTPSHISQEEVEPNGVTGLIAHSCAGIQIRGNVGSVAKLPLPSVTPGCCSRACWSHTTSVSPLVCSPLFFSLILGKGQSRSEGEG